MFTSCVAFPRAWQYVSQVHLVVIRNQDTKWSGKWYGKHNNCGIRNRLKYKCHKTCSCMHISVMSCMVCRAKEMDHKCHSSAGGALLPPHLPFVYSPEQLAATLKSGSVCPSEANITYDRPYVWQGKNTRQMWASLVREKDHNRIMCQFHCNYVLSGIDPLNKAHNCCRNRHLLNLCKRIWPFQFDDVSHVSFFLLSC